MLRATASQCLLSGWEGTYICWEMEVGLCGGRRWLGVEKEEGDGDEGLSSKKKQKITARSMAASLFFPSFAPHFLSPSN